MVKRKERKVWEEEAVVEATHQEEDILTAEGAMGVPTVMEAAGEAAVSVGEAALFAAGLLIMGPPIAGLIIGPQGQAATGRTVTMVGEAGAV